MRSPVSDLSLLAELYKDPRVRAVIKILMDAWCPEDEQEASVACSCTVPSVNPASQGEEEENDVDGGDDPVLPDELPVDDLPIPAPALVRATPLPRESSDEQAAKAESKVVEGTVPEPPEPREPLVMVPKLAPHREVIDPSLQDTLVMPAPMTPAARMARVYSQDSVPQHLTPTSPEIPATQPSPPALNQLANYEEISSLDDEIARMELLSLNVKGGKHNDITILRI